MQHICGKGLHTSLGCCVSEQDLIQLLRHIITGGLEKQFSHCDGQLHGYVMRAAAMVAGVLQERQGKHAAGRDCCKAATGI